jgi:hypothetical protein
LPEVAEITETPRSESLAKSGAVVVAGEPGQLGFGTERVVAEHHRLALRTLNAGGRDVDEHQVIGQSFPLKPVVDRLFDTGFGGFLSGENRDVIRCEAPCVGVAQRRGQIGDVVCTADVLRDGGILKRVDPDKESPLIAHRYWCRERNVSESDTKSHQSCHSHFHAADSFRCGRSSNALYQVLSRSATM